MQESPIPSLPSALRCAVQTAIEQPREVPELPPTWLTSANLALQNEDFTAMRRCMDAILTAHSQYRADFDIKGWLYDLRRVNSKYNPSIPSSKLPELARRYSNSSTGANLEALTVLMHDPRCEEVTLFATLSSDDGRFNDQTDGPEVNLPLVAALAKYRLPAGLGIMHIVFDGNFLTAARPPRYKEVQALLSVGISVKKVSVHLKPFDFTSGLTPEKAAALMLDVGETSPLDETSRAAYFSLLALFEEPQEA